ncbi:tRNA (guanosine(46)-N7)-methyltransferase TrmB [Ectothiorhodospira lacustris]|uniref:tRNA (guanosine(46)-N7)-methyltransferase TrmB n=1 Tax=Ectothiorhodospira lacustris TaxID=2899127 RepID=UPI001EE922C5|nr:tRNA (guanosine(46)-N7)-methyltransferase TrmB [Ectothiorhodospira lacustris]MCG5501952.1 tRNA (guanosine(46)-N7)-methyltransferase TrmB [Ectothiorhodospira lacustris]MCG5509661.1 tRNA (guanosine(46)-N7)-methyltransferase TrmB [Ectothiorhodospira lacustris]MCG5523106.1 tRNA (guanosine(46)-N7)-methyltransferase TrmB [Ectothiorhodospira lacustris]
MTNSLPFMPTTDGRRRIRSFVRREGRLTTGQQRALDDLWPRWGLAFTPEPLDLPALFGRQAPVTLEIGFGNGESLARMAAEDPDRNFIGVEVHRPGVGHLLQHIETLGLTNLRVACHDAVEVLKLQIPAGSLDRIQIYFPDPWPKKRHHKRRLVQPTFVALLGSRLRASGLLHLATDWEPYAEHMLTVMNQAAGFRNLAGEGFSPRPEYRPLTKFEQRGQRLGHGVWDVMFTREPGAT